MLNAAIKKDVYASVNTIHRMNAPYAKYYAFIVNSKNKGVARGCYLRGKKDNVVSFPWEYKLDMRTGNFSKY